ncbi:MAG: amidohydrolase family protein [Elusimicrobia bacterium]|nr:amidohydrolase family protein [Elusimicrobiota bacterium]
MRKSSLFLFLFFPVFGFASQSKTSSAGEPAFKRAIFPPLRPSRSMFVNVNLIDGRGGPPIKGASVIVEGERIKEVMLPGQQPRRGLREAGDMAYSFDADKGITLMPGLMDAHVHHGAIYENNQEIHRRYWFSEQVHMALLRVEQSLMQGFTTVRDAGGIDAGVRNLVDNGLVPGPRLLVAGRALSQTGGHGDRRRPSEGGSAPEGLWLSIVADGVSEVRRAVRDQFRRGVDQIKVLASGGAMSPADKLEASHYSLGELKSMVAEAGNHMSYVMAHAYSGPSILRAVKAGVRSIEHGNLLDQKAAEAMAEAGTYLVPTMITYEELVRDGKLDKEQLDKLRRALEKSVESIHTALQAGVRIASGSDLLGRFHVKQAAELALKAAIMGPMQAIVSATRVNAELFGLSGQVGSIEPGLLADLILVRGDPLSDLTILQDPANLPLIMKGGAIYKNDL